MSTARKPPTWSKSPKQVASDYLDGDYGDMSVSQVAELERLQATSVINAIKREREKRVREGVLV